MVIRSNPGLAVGRFSLTQTNGPNQRQDPIQPTYLSNTVTSESNTNITIWEVKYHYISTESNPIQPNLTYEWTQPIANPALT